MPSTSAPILLAGVAKRFPNGVLALQDASLRIGAGEFVSILGPSGCGKSTILRLLSGLEEPSAGRVESPALGSGDPQTAFVFQEPTLMPWATVFENVWLPLRLGGIRRGAAAATVGAMIDHVGLADFRDAVPAELSGGMKMRTSIARALVAQPRLLLMDEPFAALDEITRTRLGADLLRWWKERQMAVAFVTHSVYEAAFLSERVLVMSGRPGRVVAELKLDEPLPRPAEFRLTPRYQDFCRKLSAALGQSS
jgi:NitT/TauT family transport system ATP-binding protein